jgi:uncharacterized protein
MTTDFKDKRTKVPLTTYLYSMNSYQAIRTKLIAALPELKQRYPISYLALFGSVVRSDFNAETSDVDILVDFKGEIGWEFFDLQEELQQLLGHKVDLICKSALKPHYWEVIKDEVKDVAAAA